MIFIIAGEPSGDFLGASVVRILKEKNIEISGVGGKLMENAGMRSLFDIKEISVGGIVEIIPHILKIKKLIKKTADEILKCKPKVVLTIDSPGFCFRVAKIVRRKNPNIKIVHLVAPSVWAWRPKRAKHIAKLYDHLLTLFDFEPGYFEKEGLKTTFVGHPAIETFSFSDNDKDDTLLLMPGSRVQEIKSLLPIFVNVSKKLGVKNIVIPTLPHLLPLINSLAPGIKTETDENKKREIYRTSKLAIIASGTASLQLALCGCPMVVCYKISNISYKIIKKLIKIRYISLVNIIFDKPIIPELIQDECNVDSIIKSIRSVDNKKQLGYFKDLHMRLQNGMNKPSEKIVEILLGHI